MATDRGEWKCVGCGGNGCSRCKGTGVAPVSPPPSQDSEEVAEVVRTAPKRIWLQVSDEECDKDAPFPEDTEDVTWCSAPAFACEVEYVLASELTALREQVEALKKERDEANKRAHMFATSTTEYARSIQALIKGDPAYSPADNIKKLLARAEAAESRLATVLEENKRIAEKAAEDAVDAERLNWLCQENAKEHPDIVVINWNIGHDWTRHMSLKHAIDAARSQP